MRYLSSTPRVARVSAAAAIVAGLVLVGAPDVRARAHEEIVALRSDDRSVQISDHLAVNVDASRRYVFPRKCQAEGEAELTTLSAISDLEESYVFIPSICTWIEAGRDETQRSVLLDQGLVDSIARQYENIAIYHIQPGRRPSPANYLPSYRDFVSMVLIDAGYIGSPRIRVRHRAVTEFAVVDYRFADWDAVRRRAELYRSKGLGTYLAQNLAYEFSREKHLQSYATQVQLCVDRLEDEPSRIGECRRIVTDLFVLDIRAARLAAH